ncbi:MAG: hypothetical protein JWM41_3362 [Gemmatimonadetes bacterium]|nr:hypothetical protein [Gemmatimonadota bacterium]
MNSPADGAALLLKLYELRTEEKLRRARAWFGFEFHPRTTKDVLETWLGPGHESAPYRMVTTYWDMAASLVVQGAIDAPMFNAANTEHFAFYAKLRPFLPELRAKTAYPDYLASLEQVVLAAPNAEARLETFGRYMQRQAGLAAEGRQASALG